MIWSSNVVEPKGGHVPERRFTTRAQLLERQGFAKRIGGAIALAIVAIVVFVLLGPDAQTVKDKFEYYGVQDDLKIMPEVSIDNGRDMIHQLPKTLMTPPPPSHIEVEPEDLSENGTEPVPEENREPINEVLSDVPMPNPDADVAVNEQVELSLPQQSNPDYFIKHQVRPDYPLDASEAERRMPVIFVKVAIFVDIEGNVTDAMIQATNGSQIFAEEVLRCVLQWEIGYRIEPTAGRWITMTWNFNSPYFTGTR